MGIFQSTEKRKKKFHLCNVAAAKLGWKKKGIWNEMIRIIGEGLKIEEMDISKLDKILDIAYAKGFKHPKKVKKCSPIK